MKILILKQILPLAAFGAAMAGAFGTNVAERNQDAVTSVTAYPKLNLAGDCRENQPHTCEIENIGPLCSVGATQFWGKDASNKCTVPVYMEPQ